MVRAHLPADLRPLADGNSVVDVDAATVGGVIDALGDRYPALTDRLRAGVAVAVDGEVMAHAEYLQIGPDSEIHFLIPIGGG